MSHLSHSPSKPVYSIEDCRILEDYNNLDYKSKNKSILNAFLPQNFKVKEKNPWFNPWFIILFHTKPYFVCKNIDQVFILLYICNLPSWLDDFYCSIGSFWITIFHSAQFFLNQWTGVIILVASLDKQ